MSYRKTCTASEKQVLPIANEHAASVAIIINDRQSKIRDGKGTIEGLARREHYATLQEALCRTDKEVILSNHGSQPCSGYIDPWKGRFLRPQMLSCRLMNNVVGHCTAGY
jgi:hypothetical protein